MRITRMHSYFAVVAAAVTSAVFAAPPHASAQSSGPAKADTLALSVDEAVQLALRIGDEARTADAMIDIAEAQVTIARASALPQLRLNSTYTHTLENARAQAVGQIFNQPNTYNTNANLSQTFFQGGREWAAGRAASRTRAAARLNAAEARAQLALDVQRAYLNALFADRLMVIRGTGLKLAEERLVQVEQFQGAGRAARFDVLRARVERTNLEPAVIEATNERELALLELKRLTNIPSAQPVRLTTAIDTSAVQALLAAFATDTVDAVRSRPSVRAAEMMADARRSAVTAARADMLPTVAAFLQSGFQAFPPIGSGFPSERGRISTIPCPDDPPDPTCRPVTQQNGGWFTDRLVGLQISWPIFDGLRARGNIELARAQERLALIELQQEREAVAVEIARARAAVERARSLFTAQRQNAVEADEALRLASLRFARGLGTQLEASDAQLALLTAQTNEARTVYDLYLAAAELARALGRPIPVPPSAIPSRTSDSSTSAPSTRQ
ncbi:MAG: TolC family protein [Gemmatimonadaceae bacterium]